MKNMDYIVKVMKNFLIIIDTFGTVLSTGNTNPGYTGGDEGWVIPTDEGWVIATSPIFVLKSDWGMALFSVPSVGVTIVKGIKLPGYGGMISGVSFVFML
jgi:hypothetical protein